MKKQYEEPRSTAVQLLTEGVIATSTLNVQAMMPLDMEVKDASVWGNWE